MRPRNSLLISRNRDWGLALGLLLAALCAFYAYVSRLGDATHDAFHEMALARVWCTAGSFPVDDVFAFTHTVSPAVHHEWGTGLILFWTAELSPFGLHGMAVLRIVLIATLAVLLYRIARNEGAHPYLIAVFAPAVFPMLWVGFGNLRAQLFTLVLLAAQLLLMQSDWKGSRRWVFAWFLLYVVWLNIHAGFVVGLALILYHIGIRWAYGLLFDACGNLRLGRVVHSEVWLAQWSRMWHHALIPMFAVLGAGLNPWGWNYPIYLWRAITMQRHTMLEWQPLWMTYDPVVTMIAFIGSLLLIGYVAKNRRWNRLHGWFFLCLAAYMACKHLRHGSLYAVLWIAWMPGWLTATPLGRSIVACLQNRRPIAMVSCMSAMIVFAAYTVSQRIWLTTLPDHDPDGVMVYPVAACNFMNAKQLQGNLLTPFVAGGYVSWRSHPAIRVSLDGRYEVAYRDDVLPKHDRFFLGKEGWSELLEEYPVDMILVQNSAPVLEKLQGKSHGRMWTAIHADSAFTLFAKREYLSQYRELFSGSDPELAAARVE